MNKFSPRNLSTLELLEHRLLFSGRGAKIIAAPPAVIANPSTATTVNLGTYFTNDAATGTLVEMGTTQGNIDLELGTSGVTNTVNNFLSYLNSGAYNNTLFSRTISPNTINGTVPDSGSTSTVIHTNITASATNSLAGLMFSFTSPVSHLPAFAHIASNTSGANSTLTLTSACLDPLTSQVLTPASGAAISVFAITFIQGGEYNTSLQHIATTTPIANEANGNFVNTQSNQIWTIGASHDPNSPNSITSGFYFNLADNSSALDLKTATNPSGDNSGFVRFGQVVNGTTATLNTIAGIQTTAASTPDFPYANIAPGAATNDVQLTSTKIVPSLTYTVSSDNPSVVTASLDSNNNLVLTWHATSGSANITVSAKSSMTLPVLRPDIFNPNSVSATFTATADSTPPSGSTTTITAPTGGSTSVSIPIHFTDNIAINGSTIGSGDVVLKGPGNTSINGVLVSSADTSNPADAVATFQFTPPIGSRWNGANDGSYSLFIPNGSFSDAAGNLNPDLNVGTFNFNVESTPPTAMLLTPTQPGFRAARMSFSVTYSDASGIDTSTLGSDDVTVIAPDQSVHAASLISDAPNADGSVTATYSFATTDNSFGPADNGTYTVRVNDQAVTDSNGNAISQADIGTFGIAFDSQAPTASLAAIKPVGQHSPYALITIQYLDNTAVDASTLGSGDIVVTGPNSFNATGTLVTTGLSNKPSLTAQYQVAAPVGGFVPGDTFNIAMPSGVVTDTTDNGIASNGSLGTFTVINDDTPPVATTTTTPDATGGELRLKFTITYTDATGVDATSILNSPVTVTGPNGFGQTAILQSTSITDGTSLAVTYRINAPSSFFTPSDNGLYTVHLPGTIQDVVFNTMAAQTMDFNVNIPPAPDDPDLVTSVASVTSAISPLTKNKAVVNVKNVGNLLAKGSTTIKLYASTDDELDAGDTLLSTTKEKISMKAGANKNYSLKFNSPMNLATGTYRIIAVVNQDATLVERYTKNNESVSGNVTITAPFVDLQPTAISSLPKTITGGKKSSVNVTIVNNGNIPAKGNAVIQLLVSADSTLDASDHTLLTLTKGINIKPGKSVKIPLKFLLPAGLIAKGSHEFLASTVSFTGDNNANNNSVFSLTTVTIA